MTRVRRVFKVGGEPVALAPPAILPAIPRAELQALRAEADRSLPGADKETRERIGRALYRLLFGGRDGEDLFPRLAATLWGLPPGAAAHGIAVAVEIGCGPAPCAPWPLRLPWHLSAADGEPLAGCCGWSFESTPPGLRPRFAPVLSAEPPLLLLVDERVPGAVRHGTELTQLLERSHGFAADLLPCADLGQLAAAVRRTPEPEILYAYARADLDLAALAEALGDSVPLLVLNLIGEPVPAPPPALVRDRKLICALYAAGESDQARAAGAHWLQGFLTDSAGLGHQRIAVGAFGPRVRLWSGCAGLTTRIAAAHGRWFRRPLIKLLLDRIAARREVSDEVAAALAQGRGVLGLIAAGTADDHPDLLPKQVWHHYQQYREAASRDAIRRLPLVTGPIPDELELLVRFAQSLGRGRDDWEDGLDREAGDLAPGEHLILSLEWRLAACPPGEDADQWRQDWLAAWLALGTSHLATYERTGVLLVHCLIVAAADPAAAQRWTEDAQALWRARRPGLSPTGRRFAHLRLKPLSLVPVRTWRTFWSTTTTLPSSTRTWTPSPSPIGCAGRPAASSRPQSRRSSGSTTPTRCAPPARRGTCVTASMPSPICATPILPGARAGRLRRCIVHHIAMTPDLMRRAVAAHGDAFPELAPAVRAAAIARFQALRREDRLSRKPGIAELLAWLVTLARAHPGLRAADLEAPALADLPHLHRLVKDQDDREVLREPGRR